MKIYIASVHAPAGWWLDIYSLISWLCSSDVCLEAIMSEDSQLVYMLCSQEAGCEIS